MRSKVVREADTNPFGIINFLGHVLVTLEKVVCIGSLAIATRLIDFSTITEPAQAWATCGLVFGVALGRFCIALVAMIPAHLIGGPNLPSIILGECVHCFKIAMGSFLMALPFYYWNAKIDMGASLEDLPFLIEAALNYITSAPAFKVLIWAMVDFGATRKGKS